MPRFPASTPRGASLGGQNQRKLQIVALATLQELDDCLTSQPGQRYPVLVGESRQLRVFTVLQVDGHAILGCHWITRDLSGRTLQQTAPSCYRIRVTSSRVKRCRERLARLSGTPSFHNWTGNAPERRSPRRAGDRGRGRGPRGDHRAWQSHLPKCELQFTFPECSISSKAHVQALDSWPARPECSGANQRAVAKRLVGQYRDASRWATGCSRCACITDPATASTTSGRIDAGPCCAEATKGSQQRDINAPAGWRGLEADMTEKFTRWDVTEQLRTREDARLYLEAWRRGGSGRRQSDPRRAERYRPGGEHEPVGTRSRNEPRGALQGAVGRRQPDLRHGDADHAGVGIAVAGFRNTVSEDALASAGTHPPGRTRYRSHG